MQRNRIGVVLLFLIATLLTIIVGASAAEEPKGESGEAIYRGVLEVVHFDVSPRLDSMEPAELQINAFIEILDDFNTGLAGPLGPQDIDPLVQAFVGPGEIPSPITSFNGPTNSSGVSPPDPNGDVGPNHVVVMSNLSFAVYDKTGTLLFGPVLNNTLWSGFGGDCQTDNSGDPIVLYDHLADRWLLTQFTASGPTYFECVALSQTSDPAGAYYRWAIDTGSNFPDYPKVGVWPDGYYFSTREFAGSSFAGVGAYVIDRAEAVSGDPNATIISFLVPPGATPYNVGDGLLPADLDGTALPPAGSPNYFIGSMDNGGPYGAPQDALTLWKFDADFATPANSTFTLAHTIPITAYDTMFPCSPGSRDCIPQPGTGMKIDILSYRQRPMFRLAYRNFGTHESLVTNQSVEAVPGIAGMRWWEIRDPNGTPVVFQEGTYAPGATDGIHRWMGSIAMDGSGNMALGYSASSSTTFPSVWYTGRLVGDPLGTMPMGEESIITGTGSQTGSQRWGDYTSMSIDPVDDCTFWHVNQWLPSTSSVGWVLRIGSFRFDECGQPDFTLSATPDEQTICTPNSALYAVTVGQVQNFTDPVTLSASGNPAGTTTNFSTNPVTPPGSSNLTIGNMGAAAAGSYAIEVMGVAPTSTHTTTVTLNVNTAVPGAPALTTPANGATGVSLAPTFMWNTSTQGGTYDLQVATDAGFSNIVYSADDIDGTSHAAASPLAPLTQHFWRVRSANACGDGNYSAAFSFTTSDIPPILLVDDDDDSPDVQPTWTAALDALGLSYDIWVTGASDVEPTGADMAPYEVILWFSGDRFGTQNAGPAGPSPATETALATWLDGGGCFFISSQDYVWDKGVTSFMTSRLGVSTVTNDNGDYTSVTGQNVFGGLGPYTLTFPYSDFTDPITVGNGGVQAMLGNNAKVAGVSKELGAYKTSFWAFGLEALPQAGREATLEAFINWCGLAAEVPEIEVTPASLSSTQAANTTIDQTLTISNTGTGTLDWDIFEDNSPAAATQYTGAPVAGAALAGSGLTGGSVTPVSSVENPNLMITHSSSQTITAGNSVACSGDGGFTTTDNQYLRAFDLDAFGITTAFTVTSVEFGVENATSPGAGQPITVNLYEWDGVSALTYANLSLVGTTSTTLADQALTLVNVPVSGTVAAGEWLVAEVANPDGTGVNGFFIGSNALGQTGPSYLASTSCGLPNPTNVANIGFPNMMIVMNVYGDPAGDISCDAAEDIPWLSVDQSSGSTGAGSSTDVTVTYDSTGLSPGTYSAALCVTSNDSDEPEVVVPVELEVTSGYMIYLPIAVREP